MADIDNAAEYALHMWYSVLILDTCLPEVFTVLRQLGLDQPFLTNSNARVLAFGPNSKMSISFTEDTSHILSANLLLNSSFNLTPAVASNEFRNIMVAPERVDYRDRYYSGLEPSHRVTFHKWRQFGLVYPFGASNAHLNVANRWLFSPIDQRLCLNDNASPINDWE